MKNHLCTAALILLLTSCGQEQQPQYSEVSRIGFASDQLNLKDSDIVSLEVRGYDANSLKDDSWFSPPYIDPDIRAEGLITMKPHYRPSLPGKHEVVSITPSYPPSLKQRQGWISSETWSAQLLKKHAQGEIYYHPTLNAFYIKLQLQSTP